MPFKPRQPYKRGEKLSAHKLDMLRKTTVQQTRVVSVSGGARANVQQVRGGNVTRQQPPIGFWARIIDPDGRDTYCDGTTRRFSWMRVRRKEAGATDEGQWIDSESLELGRYDNPSGAREVNDRLDIPERSVVWMQLGSTGEWFFTMPADWWYAKLNAKVTIGIDSDDPDPNALLNEQNLIGSYGHHEMMIDEATGCLVKRADGKERTGLEGTCTGAIEINRTNANIHLAGKVDEGSSDISSDDLGKGMIVKMRVGVVGDESEDATGPDLICCAYLFDIGLPPKPPTPFEIVNAAALA